MDFLLHFSRDHILIIQLPGFRFHYLLAARLFADIGANKDTSLFLFVRWVIVAIRGILSFLLLRLFYFSDCWIITQ